MKKVRLFKLLLILKFNPFCKYFLFHIAFNAFLLGSLLAQELPPIVNHAPNSYEADNQNWMLSQSDDKTIYVANNRGLLVFNGEQWKLYPSPNATVMRGVLAMGDKIYTGAYMDFGVWKRNGEGELQYTSLSSKLTVNMVEDEHIWNIQQYGQHLLFQSLNRIYIYDSSNDSVKFIHPKNPIIRLFKVDEDLFYQVRGEGIYTIVNGQPHLFNATTITREERFINLFKINSQLIGVTSNMGFYLLDKNSADPWEISDNQSLDDFTIYSAIQRRDQSLVLGTIENGIIQFSPNGDFQYKIKQQTGLSNNTVLSLLEDVDQNLWVGLDAGIDCINSKSNFKQYTDISGKLGTTYVAAVTNGYTYIGTNQGLFYRPSSKKGEFTRIPETEGQVWNLRIIDGALFCGHNNGTYYIDGIKQQRISEIEGTWDIKKIPNTNLLLQGNYDGLYVLEKKNGRWGVRNKIENFVNSSKHFELTDTNKILVNHEYKGVYEIEVDSSFRKAIKVFKHTSVNKGEHSSLSRLGETILYANKEGIYSYNVDNENFVKEESLSTIFDENKFITGKLVQDQDRLWAFTKSELVYITKDKLNGSYTYKKIPIPSSYRNTVVGYENMIRIRENEYLLGTSRGYIIVTIFNGQLKNHEISLNKIIVNELGNQPRMVNYHDTNEFPSNQNNLTFSYNVAEYDKFLSVEYAYALKGQYDNWSPWTQNSNIHFENLSYGTYTFIAKARVGGKETQNQIHYEFTIKRPGYLSNVSIAIYIVLTILLFGTLNWFYKRYYYRQQELALTRTKRDMEMRALEKENQIIELQNANLKQDIDARNRELAVSTMNMINKNKTLNSIKSSLLKAEKVEDINTIIRFVDKTMENEEDWNFFEEAFNHADKDFFKKVKDRHPNLTANDLKLCVYLRLNMSSKEIAPLLNISTRSVEIKRYRLRKKLNLSRDVNLNDYFINL